MWCGQRARCSARPCCRCRPARPTATNRRTAVLEVEGLVKRFGGFTAVNKVSFKVDQGEILGLIGPNGSGKSTIFNMISGTLVPSAGSIRFAGTELAGLSPHRIINGGIGLKKLELAKALATGPKLLLA